jgi:hypothetical protein
LAGLMWVWKNTQHFSAHVTFFDTFMIISHSYTIAKIVHPLWLYNYVQVVNS